MDSVWSETTQIEAFPPLRGDVKTDVLIVGGGMAGILCAHFLQKAGVSYLLVEAEQIGGGVSKNTTAKITAQHGLCYQKLLKDAGAETAKLYLDANQQALREFRKLCAPENGAGIDCDFEEKDAFVYSLRDRKAIDMELDALQKIGCSATFQAEVPLPFDIAGAVRFPKQAQFHPLEFMAGIASGLNIFEHSPVQELAPHIAITEHAKISAEHIVLATHFPILNKHGGYFLKLYQHRSYVIALENTPDVRGIYLEETQDGLSFRNYGKLLLVGGGDHRTGKQGGNWQILRDFAANTYPGAREQYAWATQDCMSLDGVPYIGRYAKSAEGLYIASGFNKWGMTGSMVAARLLTDMILGRANEYADLFSPQRSMLKPQLLRNALTAVGNLLTPSTRRCPHMGCALKWNPAEHSWDCPCHGSRFDEDGELIDNPATGGMK